MQFNITVKNERGEMMKENKIYEKPRMEKIEFSFDAAWKKKCNFESAGNDCGGCGNMQYK